MKTFDSIHYWAHMLDESSHVSYYDMFMKEHPEDRMPQLLDNLIGEFADALKKDHINIEDCLNVEGFVDDRKVEEVQKKIKTKYYWHRIKAQVYASIISRSTALMDRAKGQKFNEDEITYDDVVHNVSRKVVEDCLDIMCHNTNVMEANNTMRLDAYQNFKKYGKLFEKHGIPKTKHYNAWYKRTDENYMVAVQLYKAWGAYAKGDAAEPYVCDSDNGPWQLKKILSSVEYAADDIDLIVALNKALDVVHFRSDLAAAFIEGGQQTCAMVSNLPHKFVV